MDFLRLIVSVAPLKNWSKGLFLPAHYLPGHLSLVVVITAKRQRTRCSPFSSNVGLVHTTGLRYGGYINRGGRNAMAATAIDAAISKVVPAIRCPSGRYDVMIFNVSGREFLSASFTVASCSLVCLYFGALAEFCPLHYLILSKLRSLAFKDRQIPMVASQPSLRSLWSAT